MTVYPHFAVVANPVELNKYLLFVSVFRELKMLAIPADPGRQKSARASKAKA